jgi:hypothetical protein
MAGTLNLIFRDFAGIGFDNEGLVIKPYWPGH